MRTRPYMKQIGGTLSPDRQSYYLRDNRALRNSLPSTQRNVTAPAIRQAEREDAGARFAGSEGTVARRGKKQAY